MPKNKITQEEFDQRVSKGVEEFGISRSRAVELLKTKFDVREKTATEKAGDFAVSALDKVVRGLDLAGGAVRAGGAAAFESATGKDVSRPEDLQRALVGKAPTSDELLDRAGIGKGQTINLPLLGEVSARGAAGLGLDIATDPLTFLTLGGAGVAKAALRPVATTAKGIGKGLQKSALSKVDRKLAAQGKKKLSTLIGEQGIKGTPDEVLDQIKDFSVATSGKVSEVLEEAAAKGITLEPTDLLDNVAAQTAKLRSSGSPKLTALADDIEEEVINILPAQAIDPAQANVIRQNIDNVISERVQLGGRAKKAAEKAQKTLADDLRKGIDKALGVEPGLQKQFKDIQGNLATALESQKPGNLPALANAEANRKAITSVDAILASGAAVDPVLTGAALGLKKTRDTFKNLGPSTRVGQSISQGAGQTAAQAGDVLLRRLLIEAQNPAPRTNQSAPADFTR